MVKNDVRRKMTKEHCDNISQALSGRKQTKEHIEKSRQTKIGKNRPDMIGNSLGFKKGQKPWNFKLTKETDKRVLRIGKKISKKRKGAKLTEEHKRNIGKSGKSKKKSEQTKQRQSLSKMGEKNPAWINGNSALGYIYPFEWTNKLKQSIRKRDQFICAICSYYPATFVHHIDYNKQNCKSDNLTTLCHSCHNRTNNKREYWKNYFYEKNKQKSFIRN